MGANTGIEWTDATWNCWQGCHKVSAGCKNCYMFAEKKRYGQQPDVVVRSVDGTFNAPLKWVRNPEKYGHIKRVFVDSWSDFFVAEADPWRSEAWAIMRQTPSLIYQLCTKRPERIAGCLPADWGAGYANVWIGTTTENQAAADKRIPLLLQTPAAVRFISAEPLLGPVDLSCVPWPEGWGQGIDPTSDGIDALRFVGSSLHTHPHLDWVICGGESGPNARPMHPDWARGLRDQCAAAGVPYFLKQWGEWAEVDGGPPNRVFNVDKQHSPPIDRTNCVIALDGHTPRAEPEMRDNVKYRWMSRVGKKAAGALIDGREWKQFPEAARG